MVGPFGPEVAGDVIFGANVKTIKGFVVVHFEVTSSPQFIPKPCDTLWHTATFEFLEIKISIIKFMNSGASC